MGLHNPPMMKKLVAFIIAMTAVGGAIFFGASPASPDGVYPLTGALEQECKDLRAAMYPRTVQNAGKFLTSDKLSAETLMAKVAGKLGLNTTDYTFDMWSCAFFTKEAQRAGKIREYRNEKGLTR